MRHILKKLLFIACFSLINQAAFARKAGVLPYTFDNETGEIIFLLGLLHKTEKFGDFGGIGEMGESHREVAAREFNEESMHFFAKLFDESENKLTDDKLYSKNQQQKMAARQKANQIIAARLDEEKMIKRETFRNGAYYLYFLEVPFIYDKKIDKSFEKIRAREKTKELLLKRTDKEIVLCRWVHLAVDEEGYVSGTLVLNKKHPPVPLRRAFINTIKKLEEVRPNL